MPIRTIESISAQLSSFPGTRYTILSTTSNIHNPPLYIASTRQTSSFIVSKFVFSQASSVEAVIAELDGTVDAFLVDVEVKNNFTDLFASASRLVSQSPVIPIKPNDMTVDSLDTWLSILYPTLHDINILISGLGNIGLKSALRLSERGAHVFLHSRSHQKENLMSSTLSLIKRGSGSISSYQTTLSANSGVVFDTYIGCTPGVPFITRHQLRSSTHDSILIDVGNGTFTDDALAFAHEQQLRILCLTPDVGFDAWLASFHSARHQLSNISSQVHPSGLRLITPGILGCLGDIVVDDPRDFTTIIGVANGRGDFLDPEDSLSFTAKLQQYADPHK